MKHIDIKVPRGTKFIGEWKEYDLPAGHCIVDKGVTGCGYTEYCISNDKPVVLCSPRILLLENKLEQHKKKGDNNIYYYNNNFFEKGKTKKEISEQDYYQWIKDMEMELSLFMVECDVNKVIPKILVTYDSAHYVIDYLKSTNRLEDFYFIVDEFQSIFVDAYFKAEVENSFVEYLQECFNVVYLSATPMLEKYLDRVPEFKNLPLYSIDWSDSGYVEFISISRKQTTSLISEAVNIINDFLKGKFPITLGEDGNPYKSTEAVMYFNSVTDIIRVINKTKLKPEQANVICSREDKNKIALRRIGHSIGKVPTEDEPNKMFTFCTKTVYVGVDFYSDCASTYVFADPNIANLALDISLDLPQIAGRQRNRNNNFKSKIAIFYKTTRIGKKLERKDFDKAQELRQAHTDSLLDIFKREKTNGNEMSRGVLVDKIRAGITVDMYSKDFVSISRKTGEPVDNEFIKLANERAWEVSQDDYQDRINVTRALLELKGVKKVESYLNNDDMIVKDFLDNHFYKTGQFTEKLKMFCEFVDEHKDNKNIVEQLQYKIRDHNFINFYNYFGTAGCKARGYRLGELYNAFIASASGNDIKGNLLGIFQPGSFYSRKEIKEKLKGLYKKLGLKKTPKATDIEEWFEVKEIMFWDSREKINIRGYRIIGVK